VGVEVPDADLGQDAPAGFIHRQREETEKDADIRVAALCGVHRAVEPVQFEGLARLRKEKIAVGLPGVGRRGGGEEGSAVHDTIVADEREIRGGSVCGGSGIRRGVVRGLGG
jgi:hypothetical protein